MPLMGPRVMADLTGWARQAQPCLWGAAPCRMWIYCMAQYAAHCLTAYDPHSSRPHFFKSGQTAWHDTKESTWYLARNYHEPGTTPARKRPQGQASQSQDRTGFSSGRTSAPYHYSQQPGVVLFLILLWLWLIHCTGQLAWLAAGPLLLNLPLPSQVTRWACLLVPLEFRIVFALVDMPVFGAASCVRIHTH
jgi:hypothetical protein